jgi:hypothetical protein
MWFKAKIMGCERKSAANPRGPSLKFATFDRYSFDESDKSYFKYTRHELQEVAEVPGRLPKLIYLWLEAEGKGRSSCAT